MYGEELISKKGPIPVHLTGNPLGQDFNAIIDLLTPYPNEPVLSITDALVNKVSYHHYYYLNYAFIVYINSAE